MFKKKKKLIRRQRQRKRKRQRKRQGQRQAQAPDPSNYGWRFGGTQLKISTSYTIVAQEYRWPQPTEASAQRRRPMAMETSAQANDCNAIGCLAKFFF